MIIFAYDGFERGTCRPQPKRDKRIGDVRADVKPVAWDSGALAGDTVVPLRQLRGTVRRCAIRDRSGLAAQ